VARQSKRSWIDLRPFSVSKTRWSLGGVAGVRSSEDCNHAHYAASLAAYVYIGSMAIRIVSAR
jgi:hypothetical protein